MIDTIASTTVSILVLYLKKAAQGTGEKLYEIVKEKFYSDPILKELFATFEQEPGNESKQKEMRDKLQTAINNDQSFKDKFVSVNNNVNIYGDISGKQVTIGTVNGNVNI